MGNYTGLIITLVLILILVIAVYIGVAALKRKPSSRHWSVFIM